MTFRKATSADLSAVAEIYAQIHTLEEQGLASTGWLRTVYPTAATAERALANGELYVLEDDAGAVVASGVLNQKQMPEYAAVTWEHQADDAEVYVLHTLSVDPRQRGKGYGKAFVAHYEQMAAKQGCTVLRIDTNSRNTTVRTMYAHLGFREAGIVPCEFNGIPGVYLVCLEKPVTMEG